MNTRPGNNDPPIGQRQEPEEDCRQALREFENLAADLSKPTYLFRLYIAGVSPRSMLAINNVRGICEQHLPGRYQLEVIDIYQQLPATKEAQVIAVPTLIKELPLPPQRFVGDMSDTGKIVVALKLNR